MVYVSYYCATCYFKDVDHMHAILCHAGLYYTVVVIMGLIGAIHGLPTRNTNYKHRRVALVL